jgi:type 2A phosphatase activator TIP41
MVTIVQANANRKHVHSEIKDVIKPFDWSYTTDYKGTVSCPSPGGMAFAPTEMQLPIHLLKLPEPILFFSSVDLFEDELADNGMSLLTVKIRVMPQRMLLLARFFLRLDGVIVRIRDTRVYVEFDTRLVLREYTAREERYEAIKQTLGARPDVAAIMRDPDKLTALCPVVETIMEQVVLSPSAEDP